MTDVRITADCDVPAEELVRRLNARGIDAVLDPEGVIQFSARAMRQLGMLPANPIARRRVKRPCLSTSVGKRGSLCACGRRRKLHLCPPEYHVHLDESECGQWSCP